MVPCQASPPPPLSRAAATATTTSPMRITRVVSTRGFGLVPVWLGRNGLLSCHKLAEFYYFGGGGSRWWRGEMDAEVAYTMVVKGQQHINILDFYDDLSDSS